MCQLHVIRPSLKLKMNVSLFSAMRLKIFTCVSKWAVFPANITVGLFNITSIPPFVAKNVFMNHTHYANI